MPSEKEPHYLHFHRNRIGLSQDDVAQLTGCKSGAKFSRYENFLGEPNLRTALACEIIFGVPVRTLFAGYFEAAQLSTAKQAVRLLRRLKTSQRRGVPVKVEALGVILQSCKESKNNRGNA